MLEHFQGVLKIRAEWRPFKLDAKMAQNMKEHKPHLGHSWSMGSSGGALGGIAQEIPLARVDGGYSLGKTLPFRAPYPGFRVFYLGFLG